MEPIRVDMIALFTAALGETIENTRMTERMPDIVNHAINSTARNLSEHIRKQMHEVAGLNVTINDNVVDIRDVIEKDLVEHVREGNKDLLQDSEKLAAKCHLPRARWDRKVKRILESIAESDAKTIQVRFQDLLDDFCEELNEPYFCMFHPIAVSISIKPCPHLGYRLP